MNYDKVILECIENKFKSAKQISKETGINKSRVSVKLNSLKRYNLVISMQGHSQKKGVKPLLYKKK